MCARVSRGSGSRTCDLHQVSIYLLLIQLLASILVECSLTTVIQSSPTATLMSTGAASPAAIRKGHGGAGNTVNAIRVSTPNMAAKLSEMASSLSMKSDHFQKASATMKAADALEIASEQQDISANKVGETLLQRLGGMVKNAIAPTKSYVDLVNRYHKWFNKYRTLQSSSEHQLRDASDVLREEYAKVDEIMMEEEAAKHAYEMAQNQVESGSESELSKRMDPKRAENMDFIFKALRLVIERLEQKLEDLEKREGVSIDDESVSSSGENSEELEEQGKNDERIQRAMERVKRTVMKSAKNLLTGEMAIIARTAVFNGLAQYMAAKPDTGDALDHLRPIISMLGSASTPLAVSYLMSIEFRAALAVINEANPLSLFGINIKKKSHQV